MHVDIFASLKNQIYPHFSLSCIFVLENSVVNLSERVDIFCKPEESHSSAARAATGNLCQKAQIAKSWKYFSANLTHRAASALGRASQPGKKTNHCCRNFFAQKYVSWGFTLLNYVPTNLLQSLAESCVLSQEQLTQESMEGVEAAEGETSWGRPGAQVTKREMKIGLWY